MVEPPRSQVWPSNHRVLNDNRRNNRLVALRRNLVRGHACGLGEPLSEPEVRAMLLLRANVLAKGVSGIRSQIVEMLVSFLKRRVHPVVPARGSVGVSGDLAPLPHVALVLIGERFSIADSDSKPPLQSKVQGSNP